jgi:hypothetical protein
MIYALIFIAFGFYSFIRASVIAEKEKKRHSDRLTQLIAGEPEIYFEERRSLEAYPPRSVGRLQLFGLLAVVLGVLIAFRS